MDQEIENTPKLVVGQENSSPFKPGSEELLVREPLEESDLKRIIREMGLKVTHQRLTILKALSAGRAHVTAQEIYERVHENYQDIGFATVYRFLKKLTQTDFVTEVRMGGLPARYEITPRHHHDHITCKKCNKIVEFENLDIEKLQLQVAKELGFRLTGHVLELYGICTLCQNHQAQ